jgi:hypothetical protein
MAPCAPNSRTSCHVRRTGARKLCPDSIESETEREEEEEEEGRDPERDLDESEERYKAKKQNLKLSVV